MEQFAFYDRYRIEIKKRFGREPEETECKDSWQEMLREREREREREDEERKSAAMRLVIQEPSLSPDARMRIVEALRGNRQLARDIVATSTSPSFWELLAQPAPVPTPAVPSAALVPTPAVPLPDFQAFAERLAPSILRPPAIYDLHTFLLSELNDRIPVTYAVADELQNVLVQRASDYPELAIAAACIRYLPPTQGVGENSNIKIIDALVTDVIVGLSLGCGLDVSVGRNVADYTGATTARLKPDLIVWLNGKLLIFKGEEKYDVNKFQDSVSELKSKLPADWEPEVQGRLPYILCYAAAGGKMQFYAVPTTGTRTPLAISRVYYLISSTDRALIVRCVVNLVRIFRELGRYAPTAAVPPLYAEIKTRHSKLTVMDGFVVKRTTMFTPLDVLEGLYRALELANWPGSASATPFLVIPTRAHMHAGLLSVQLRPVAAQGVLPVSEQELRDCIQSVLRALAWLHQHGWVHRDVRWPNVLHAPQTGWLLADLELAVPTGTGDSLITLPPEIVDRSQAWTPQADVFMVGQLMQDYQGSLSVRAFMFRNRLLAGQAERPSAQDAQLDAWFQGI